LGILIIVLIMTFLGCSSKNQNNDNDYIYSSGDAVQNSVNEDTNNPLNNNIPSILDYINKDTIYLAKYLFDLDIDLEGMEKEYGPIMKVDWIDGALYKHERLVLWIAYFTAEIEGDFVVSDVVSYLDYSKEGPFTILEQAKKAPIFYLKCELSNLFDKPDTIVVEDFVPFVEVYESLEWIGKDIFFDYDKLTIRIMCNDDDTLHGDCVVILSSII